MNRKQFSDKSDISKFILSMINGSNPHLHQLVFILIVMSDTSTLVFFIFPWILVYNSQCKYRNNYVNWILKVLNGCLVINERSLLASVHSHLFL